MCTQGALNYIQKGLKYKATICNGKCSHIKSEALLKLYLQPQQFTNILLPIFDMVYSMIYQVHLCVLIPQKL